MKGRNIAQVVEHTTVKVWILIHGGSTVHGRSIYSLDYFPFQPVVHNRSMKGCGMCWESEYKRSPAAYQKE